MRTSGMRRAAAAKNSRGVAVATPDRTSSAVWPGPVVVNVVAPCAVSTARITPATGASTAVSAARECIAPSVVPIFFLTRP
jgi:hypothetical protein